MLQYVYIHPRDMEDFEPASTLIDLDVLLCARYYMHLHPRDMEGPAIVTTSVILDFHS